MISKEEIEKLLDCSDCPFVACETCDITYTDRKDIREYIEDLEHEKDIMQRALAIQTQGWNEGAKLFAEKQKLIEKLEEIVNRNAELYDSKNQKEVDFSEWNLAQEILEIVRGN